MPAVAETLRLATFHTDLTRRGPGVLLADIRGGDDPQVAAVIEMIGAARPDVLLLLDIDGDAGGATAAVLAAAIAGATGLTYAHRHAGPGNSGRPTGHDLDGDGRRHRAADAHGYGRFTGEGAMALLSRHPLGPVQAFDHLPWAAMPGSAAAAVTPAAALPVLRLHPVAAWAVPVQAPGGTLTVLATHAPAPVFDGPEDRNGRRNADVLRFWQHVLDGAMPPGTGPPPAAPLALMGTLNVDPARGEGDRATLAALIAHPALQDPVPRDGAGRTETVDWPDPDPGDLRVDYVLPGAGLAVLGAGMVPPHPDRGVPHALVWVDVRIGPPLVP